MNIRRRQLIKLGLLGTSLIANKASPQLLIAENQLILDEKKLSILILGGTGFIGPHMVREALKRGHEITLFNRGRTNPNLFKNVETLFGDRDNGLEALYGHNWDVVIDNSGYVPRHVEDSSRLLSTVASHYIYISSISAYADLSDPIDEDAPLAKISDEAIEQVTPQTYGPLKALCEKKAATEFGDDRLTILRPTYIVGPGDHTDRYTYWLARSMRGSEMIWPGTPKDMIQIIDVRDLAKFTIDTAVNQIMGTYNTVTPAGSYTMGQLLQDSLKATASNMKPVWIDHKFLKAQEDIKEDAFPIWIPPVQEYSSAALVSGKRANAKGLLNRPTIATAKDTLAWWKTLPTERTKKLRAGLSLELEKDLLNRFKS